MATATVFEFEGDPQVGLLDAVRAELAARDAAEVRMLHRVVEFCAAHQVEEAEAATVTERGRDTGLALAGPGAPFVSEFAIIELASTVSMTADAGRRYVGRVLEVRHRLPLIWDRVESGDLAWWRAARIADHTVVLPAAGAAHVDRRLAAVAHKVGVIFTEKLCQEALDAFDPAQAEERREAAAENRRVDVHLDQTGRHGTVDIAGSADTADALDLEAALAQAAAELAANGCGESLDVRRSMALGLIARHYLGAGNGPLVKPRQVQIHVHLRDPETGRCDNTRAPISVEQVRGWCTNPDTDVTIRPVVDLNEHIRVDGYEVPDRLAHQAEQRDGTCIHPWCTRPARSCDKDHAIPYHRGGTTSTDNIAPLCRPHHRAKTRGRWRYRFLRPGNYLW
ncbi:MAG TPA: HNH endonuclease signature motif containing protein, partial [Nocardioides sp.]|nr:HNH endonuclease signature motif containing protein [Nocardioides sp.]